MKILRVHYQDGSWFIESGLRLTRDVDARELQASLEAWPNLCQLGAEPVTVKVQKGASVVCQYLVDRQVTLLADPPELELVPEAIAALVAARGEPPRTTAGIAQAIVVKLEPTYELLLDLAVLRLTRLGPHHFTSHACATWILTGAGMSWLQHHGLRVGKE